MNVLPCKILYGKKFGKFPLMAHECSRIKFKYNPGFLVLTKLLTLLLTHNTNCPIQQTRRHIVLLIHLFSNYLTIHYCFIIICKTFWVCHIFHKVYIVNIGEKYLVRLVLICQICLFYHTVLHKVHTVSLSSWKFYKFITNIRGKGCRNYQHIAGYLCSSIYLRSDT